MHAFHGKAERSPDSFELREQEIAELVFQTHDKTKEQEIVVPLASFGDMTRQAGAGKKNLARTRWARLRSSGNRGRDAGRAGIGEMRQ
jgi:hypothetical protein